MVGISHTGGSFLLPYDAALEYLFGSSSYGINADYSNAGRWYDCALIHVTAKGDSK